MDVPQLDCWVITRLPVYICTHVNQMFNAQTLRQTLQQHNKCVTAKKKSLLRTNTAKLGPHHFFHMHYEEDLCLPWAT